MGYESTVGYDPRAKLLIRWGGHNQGGGGEQNAETWTYDPVTSRWALKHTNDAPPGVCCGQQNVFDVARGRFVRFSSFSGSHGWQWLPARERYRAGERGTVSRHLRHPTTPEDGRRTKERRPSLFLRPRREALPRGEGWPIR
jgi:hypothetical protein